MPLRISRRGQRHGRPRGSGDGRNGSRCAYSAPDRSLGYGNRVMQTRPQIADPPRSHTVSSAGSGGLFGNGEMRFMGTPVGVGNAVGELLDGEQAVSFEDAAFGVDPGGLNGVEPRTLDRQVA